MMNRRGDVESIIFIVVMLFVAGIVFLFVSKMNQEIYSELNTTLVGDGYGNTESVSVLATIIEKDQVIWDYAFLALFMGMVLAMGITSWSVRLSPVFFFVYVIITLFVLVLGAGLSNTWQDMAVEPEFATTITHFPITNFILGGNFMRVMAGVIFFTLVIMFAKPPQGVGE